MKRLVILSLIVILLLAGCGLPGDPILDDLYTKNVYPGAADVYSVGSEDLPYNEGWFNDGHFADIYASDDALISDTLGVGGHSAFETATFNDQITLVDDGRVWLEFSPDLDFESVRAFGVPTWVTRGVFGGFSLSIFAADNE